MVYTVWCAVGRYWTYGTAEPNKGACWLKRSTASEENVGPKSNRESGWVEHTPTTTGKKEEKKGSVLGKTKDSSSAETKAIGSYPMDCSRPETCDMPRSAFAASPSCQPPPAPRSCHFVHSTATGWQVPTEDRHLRPRPSWRQAARWSATFGVFLETPGTLLPTAADLVWCAGTASASAGSMQHTTCNIQHAAFHVHGELA